MPLQYSQAFHGYNKAFEDPDEPFIFYYRFEDDNNINRITFTRSEFLSLSQRAAAALERNGQGKGDKLLGRGNVVAIRP